MRSVNELMKGDIAKHSPQPAILQNQDAGQVATQSTALPREVAQQQQRRHEEQRSGLRLAVAHAFLEGNACRHTRTVNALPAMRPIPRQHTAGEQCCPAHL